jgi:hypothetical protein
LCIGSRVPEGQSRSCLPIVECMWTFDQSSSRVQISKLCKELWFEAMKPTNVEFTKFHEPSIGGCFAIPLNRPINQEEGLMHNTSTKSYSERLECGVKDK